MALYTSAELIEKIKIIDAKLDKALSESELDSGQGRQQFKIAVSELREQREYYLSLLNTSEQASSGGGLVAIVNRPW